MDHALGVSADALWRDAGKREEMLETLRKRGRFGPIEVRTSRQDGTPLDTMMASVARFEKGVLTEVHACMIDITDHKKLEEQFRQSQKMEAVGQLAGGMAHDFNNLLTVIKAYVQLALGEIGEDAPLRADMKIIGDAADRAAELTRQLLAFSRQQVLQPMRINLHSVITTLEPMLRALLGPEMDLTEDFERPVPDIEADRSQIEQVLMNLVVNARDAMPSGGTITFTTGECYITPDNVGGERRCRARIVRDARAFATPALGCRTKHPHRSSSRSSRRRHREKEPGLGLSTVYGIIKQSGGHIKVQSVPGLGTTFTIMLPAAKPFMEEGLGTPAHEPLSSVAS